MIEFLRELGMLANMKDKVNDMMEDMQKRIRKSVERGIKMATLTMVMFLGIIFALVGLAKYLTETVPSLAHGMGFVVVGLVLLFLAITSKLLSSN